MPRVPAQLDEIIAALEKLSVDKKARKWGLTKEEQTNLQTSKAEKMQLLAAKEKALGKLSTQHDDKCNPAHRTRKELGPNRCLAEAFCSFQHAVQTS